MVAGQGNDGARRQVEFKLGADRARNGALPKRMRPTRASGAVATIAPGGDVHALEGAHATASQPPQRPFVAVVPIKPPKVGEKAAQAGNSGGHARHRGYPRQQNKTTTDGGALGTPIRQLEGGGVADVEGRNGNAAQGAVGAGQLPKGATHPRVNVIDKRSGKGRNFAAQLGFRALNPF